MIVSQKLQLQAEEQKATFLPPCQRSSFNNSRNPFMLAAGDEAKLLHQADFGDQGQKDIRSTIVIAHG